jgi:GxxExxY protein
MKRKESGLKQGKSLSYKVIGICQEVQRSLGSSLQEKYYQRALEKEFELQGIHFDSELRVPLHYKDKMIGYKQVDFVLEKKLLLETKAVPFMKKDYEIQVLAYLNTLQLRIGLLVNFREMPLMINRILLPDKYLNDENLKSNES